MKSVRRSCATIVGVATLAASGLIVFAAATSDDSAASSSRTSLHTTQMIDFNNPTELAWSLELLAG